LDLVWKSEKNITLVLSPKFKYWSG